MPGIRSTGQRRRAGPVRDPAVQAAGSSDGRNRVSDDVDLDVDPLAPSLSDSLRGNPTDAIQSPSREENLEEIGALDVDSEGEALAPATARERRIANLERKRRLTTKDTGDQADDAAGEDWRAFDVSKAMSALRSPDPETRRKAIQRLHIRWWHAGVEPLSRTFRVAGAPAQAIADVPAIVQACNICRDWKRPPPGNIATYRITMEFNAEVQFDLIFYNSLLEPQRGLIPIAHLIDTCIRFSAGAVTTKEEVDLVTTIAKVWISIFGPMTVLCLDEETGMRGQCAMDWALAVGVHLKFKAPRQKAWLVERHNEIIRQGLHRTESQLRKEDIRATFDQVLATTIFMKNSLTVINSSTPYQALLGRQPAMLPPLEGGHAGQCHDHARVETNEHNRARVREIAAINIIEATAQQRLERVDRSNSRPAIELQEYKPHDLVDIWFEPQNKDQKGWRGPGEILSINADEGNYSVKIQGRTLSRRAQEVRPHIPYFIYMLYLHTSQMDYWIMIRSYCEGLSRGTCITLGVVLSEATGRHGWLLTKSSQVEPGKSMLQAGLAVAHHSFLAQTCTTIRMWKGLPTLGPLKGFTHSDIFTWIPGMGTDEENSPSAFSAEPGDIDTPIPCKLLAQDLQEVWNNTVKWQEVCFIQFLGVDDEDADDIIRRVPLTSTIGGAGYHRARLGSQRNTPVPFSMTQPPGLAKAGGLGPPQPPLLPLQPLPPLVHSVPDHPIVSIIQTR